MFQILKICFRHQQDILQVFSLISLPFQLYNSRHKPKLQTILDLQINKIFSKTLLIYLVQLINQKSGIWIDDQYFYLNNIKTNPNQINLIFVLNNYFIGKIKILATYDILNLFNIFFQVFKSQVPKKATCENIGLPKSTYKYYLE